MPVPDRAWALLLARWILGLIFFMAGAWKVFGLGPLEHARGLFVEPYADTFLPAWSLWLTGTIIPPIEMIAGALLLVGLAVRPALLALGAVLVVVTFGHLLAEPLFPFHRHVVPRAALVILLLWLPRGEDRLTVDAWLERRKRLRRGVTICVLALAGSGALAQEIDRDAYLRYLPKSYPRAVSQTEASVDLALFGDPADPDYRDEAPLDGIDDTRGRTLHALAVRFAPYLVQNTTALPMDFKRFWDLDPSFPLIVDSWNIAAAPAARTATHTISLPDLTRRPCSDPVNALGPQDDCALLRLLREFRPESPDNRFLTTGLTGAAHEEFKVLFLDMPGHDPESWKREYEDSFSGLLPRRYQDFARAYAHPFLRAVESPRHGLRGYELIFQYWFYYPTNDGGNNHEGDWEHINVAIAPRSAVDRPLTREETLELLSTPADRVGHLEDPLVIQRVELYFHHFVQVLDYSRPNAYLAREEWEREVDRIPEQTANEKSFWRLIRRLAYWDDDETVLNTHPVAYIGADNKGLDQLLHPPGGRNRDSHGTYPFPGMYKGIGPLGATEQISAAWFDHRRWYAEGHPRNERFGRGEVVAYDEPALIELVPDWERVADLVQEDVRARREWFWMVLPLRWGYPAMASPGAGIVGDADTGNLAPVGPSYNRAWNRSGAAPGYDLYVPHKLPSLFPLGWQDNFVNSWGFLNLTLPTLVAMPPFDFIWRIGSAPFRYALGRPDPVYYAADRMPTRFLGIAPVYSVNKLPSDFSALLLNENQLAEILDTLVEVDPEGLEREDLPVTEIHDDATGLALQFGFFVGRKLVTENLIRHSRSTVGTDFTLLARPDNPLRVRADLNMWEYAASTRYNLSTGNLMPFLKGGWGLSWYRIENATIDGEPMANPDGPWIRKPDRLKNFLPNTFHIGTGLEFNAISALGPPPGGLDIAARVDWTLYWHTLGIQEGAGELAPDIAFLLLDGEGVTRHQFNFSLVLGF